MMAGSPSTRLNRLAMSFSITQGQVNDRFEAVASSQWGGPSHVDMTACGPEPNDDLRLGAGDKVERDGEQVRLPLPSSAGPAADLPDAEPGPRLLGRLPGPRRHPAVRPRARQIH